MNEKSTTPAEPVTDRTPELADLPVVDAANAEAVKGGSLLDTALKGQVLKKVEIHGSV